MANKLIIAAAGSGKTTFLVREALKITDKNVLITTYTEANEAEIRRKIIEENKCVPANITVQTWFSFLLQHGVRPYQGCLFEPDIKGMILVNEQSGLKYTMSNGTPVYYKEDGELERHYFDKGKKIYSDKISKFVLKCDEKSDRAVIRRLSKIFSHIFIDEVQDLAGYDLDLISLLFASDINVLLVGDPRQVTYLTHQPKKYKKYRNGSIKEFVVSEIKKQVDYIIDETSLASSHRNNQAICDYSSKLFLDFPRSTPCECLPCRKATEHEGIFLVRPDDVEGYLSQYSAVQLRNKKNVPVDDGYPVKNFGESKGLTFERVLIYLTQPMRAWIKSNTSKLSDEGRSKLYVAITRARYSVAFVYDYKDDENIDGIEKYTPSNFRTITFFPSSANTMVSSLEIT